MGLMLVWGRSYLNSDKAVRSDRAASAMVAEIENPTSESVALAARIDRYLGHILGCCGGDPRTGKTVIAQGLRKLDAAPTSIRDSFEVRRARNDLLNPSVGYLIFEGADADGTSVDRIRSTAATPRNRASAFRPSVLQRVGSHMPAP